MSRGVNLQKKDRTHLKRTRNISRSSSSDISMYSIQTICLLANIRLYLGGSCFPGFPAFCLYQYFLLLSLAKDQLRMKDIESYHLTFLYLRRPAIE